MNSKQHRIIIDTDPGLGLKSPVVDVDDGIAIFFALNSPEFLIEGITTVFGNTKVDIGYKLANHYLKLAKRTDIPLMMGSSSKKDLGKSNPAVKFLIKKIKEYPGEITLFLLGPLTNIATAQTLYPDCLDNLKEIIIMGGTLSPISVNSSFFKKIDRRFYDKIPIQPLVAEWNFKNDPEATKIIIEAKTKTPRFELGIDICSQLTFGKKQLKILKTHNTTISEFIYSHSLFWFKIARIYNTKGFIPWDTFCPIYKLRPNYFNIAKLPLSVDTKKMPGKLRILPLNKSNENRLINVVSTFKSEEYKEDYLNFLCSRLK